MKAVECAQYTAEYWEAHRGIPGASDADSVASPAKGDYPASAQTLIDRLIADRFDPFYGRHDENATEAMKNGLRNEPRARSWLEYELDCRIDECGLWVSDCGRWCCSPDGAKSLQAGVEMKIPNLKTHVKYMRAGGLPNIYRPQVHWSLIVSGFPCWYWCSWNPFLPAVIVRVEPDDFTEKLRANMEKFHEQYTAALAQIQSLLPPPPEPIISDFGALGTVTNYPNEVISPF